MNRHTRISAVVASILGCCATAPVLAADGDWEHTVIIYAMGAAIDGEARQAFSGVAPQNLE